MMPARSLLVARRWLLFALPADQIARAIDSRRRTDSKLSRNTTPILVFFSAHRETILPSPEYPEQSKPHFLSSQPGEPNSTNGNADVRVALDRIRREKQKKGFHEERTISLCRNARNQRRGSRARASPHSGREWFRAKNKSLVIA